MARVRRMLIVDGYTDEPAGLGVPPYLDVYAREAYGALKLADKSNEVYYLTIDEVRRDWSGYAELSRKVDLVLVIAGALVPGKYLGGEPLRSPAEFERLKFLSSAPVALTGPAASFGLGGVGGSVSTKVDADYLIRGRVAHWVYEAAVWGPEGADDVLWIDNYALVDKALIRGSEVVKQHPNYSMGNLVVELETYSGCARSVARGCSFCLTPLKGRPVQRDVRGIIGEVEALYNQGVRSFRIGRQSDVLVYGSPELGREEWPRPSPSALRQLFQGIRNVAPSLITLHIDNVNPGTISRWPEESELALKEIVKWHTPGDVAAMGIESIDPRVVKINNLKVMMEDALIAIRIVNKVGRHRGWNGMPHLLPGINFIAGLPGESKETWEHNKALLDKIEEEGLLVRRVNLRKLSLLPGTQAYFLTKKVVVSKGYEGFRKYVLKWQERMLKNVVPPGTVLRNLVVEKVERRVSYARQPASYPLTVEIARPLPKGRWITAVVKRVHARSVLAEVL